MLPWSAHCWKSKRRPISVKQRQRGRRPPHRHPARQGSTTEGVGAAPNNNKKSNQSEVDLHGHPWLLSKAMRGPVAGAAVFSIRSCLPTLTLSWMAWQTSVRSKCESPSIALYLRLSHTSQSLTHSHRLSPARNLV